MLRTLLPAGQKILQKTLLLKMQNFSRLAEYFSKIVRQLGLGPGNSGHESIPQCFFRLATDGTTSLS
jgi:hypothetical protein